MGIVRVAIDRHSNRVAIDRHSNHAAIGHRDKINRPAAIDHRNNEQPRGDRPPRQDQPPRADRPPRDADLPPVEGGTPSADGEGQRRRRRRRRGGRGGGGGGAPGGNNGGGNDGRWRWARGRIEDSVSKRTLITSGLPYANGSIHLRASRRVFAVGHLRARAQLLWASRDVRLRR